VQELRVAPAPPLVKRRARLHLVEDSGDKT
jgi:hypothetical protein